MQAAADSTPSGSTNLVRGLAPIGEQNVEGDAEEIRAEGRPRRVAGGTLQDGDKGVLREFLRPLRVEDPPPEEAPDRAAVTFEQLFERLARAPLHVEHQFFVSRHRCFRKPPTGAASMAA